MATIQGIYDFLNLVAPFNNAMEWDNSGILLDSDNKKVQKILLTLDVTADTAAEAQQIGADLVISHHPLIFRPISRLGPDHPAFWMARANIPVISAHTNLDVAPGGVNDMLAETLGLQAVEPLWNPGENAPAGRIGFLGMPMEPLQFAQYIKQRLGREMVHGYCATSTVSRVAVVGGAGGDYLEAACRAGAEALVTADIKHHTFLEARQRGVTLLDAGHFETERPVLKALQALLQKTFPETTVQISKEKTPVHYY